MAKRTRNKRWFISWAETSSKAGGGRMEGRGGRRLAPWPKVGALRSGEDTCAVMVLQMPPRGAWISWSLANTSQKLAF